MKYKSIYTVLVLLTFTICAHSQTSIRSVDINTKEVTYQRKGKNISEYKKKFSVNYPEFSGIKNNLVQKNLNTTVNFWKAFDTTLEENLGDYTWLDSMNFKINFLGKSILDIQLIMEGSGAYPSTSYKNLVINLNTGKQVQIADVFTDIGQLLIKIDKAQKIEITQARAEARKDGNDIDDYLNDRDYTNRTLEDFTVNEKGVTFLYDYGFPHVAKALEPEGEYFFTWTELKPFIRRDGLLGQFIP
jgi:hypothetical protein